MTTTSSVRSTVCVLGLHLRTYTWMDVAASIFSPPVERDEVDQIPLRGSRYISKFANTWTSFSKTCESR